MLKRKLASYMLYFFDRTKKKKNQSKKVKFTVGAKSNLILTRGIVEMK